MVTWTPHFSVQDPPAWSTFQLYKDAIFQLIKKHGDIFFIIRPHPHLFVSLRNGGHWTEADEETFRQNLACHENCVLDERADYTVALSLSDALMTDAGSFLLEFFCTGKPLLYLEHPDGFGLNDDGDIVKFVYSAKTIAEIESFCRMIAEGRDTKGSIRRTAIPQYVGLIDGKNGERIADHIYESVISGDLGTSCPIELEKDHLDASQYWQRSTSSYLASPDFYKRQEDALYLILNGLKFKSALDIGCSDGRFTRIIAEHADRTHGIDISRDLIDKARSATIEGSVVNYSLESLDDLVTCGTYDLVSCMGVLSGIIDNELFLRSLDLIAAMVRPRGHLLLKETLSLAREQRFRNKHYVASYRNVDAYLRAIKRRGMVLQNEAQLAHLAERNQVNRLYLFKRAF